MFDLSQYKFIVSSGCSYGMIPQSLQQYKDKNLYKIDNDCVIIDLQRDSQSAHYSCDSIIHTIEVLLKYGAKPEKIFVINEWTSWDRTHMVLPQSATSQMLKKSEYYPLNVIRTNNDDGLINFINDILGFKMAKFDYNEHCPIVFINSLIYVNPSHLNVGDYRKTNYHFWIKFYQEQHHNIQNETLINDYFGCILKLQYYLKHKNIEYKFHFMHSVFSNFFTDRNGDVYQNFESRHLWDDKTNSIIHNENQFEEFYNSLSEDNDIINAFPPISDKVNQIDFSKIWFYEDDKVRFGGVDEYVITNFPYFGYSSKYFEPEHLKYTVEMFNNHPQNILYLFIANEVLENCSFIKFDYEKMNKLKEDIFDEVYRGNDLTNNYFLTLSTLKNKFSKNII